MSEIQIDSDGVQIDAEIVAKALKLDTHDLQKRMREGTVTSRFERGEGADAGRMRLTFFSDTRRARFVADASGALLSCTSVTFAPAKASETRGDTARGPDHARLDALLDTALEGSFPASDPVALAFDKRE